MTQHQLKTSTCFARICFAAGLLTSAVIGCGPSDNGLRPLAQGAFGGAGAAHAPDAATGTGGNAAASGVAQCTSLTTPGVLHPFSAAMYAISGAPGEPGQASAYCGTLGHRPAPIGPTPTDTQLSLLFGILSDSKGLDDYAMQVSDPASPLYRHYLTPAQIAAMFGPSDCNSQAFIAWAQAHGLSTDQEIPGFVDVGGTVAQFNEALHVTFENYRRYDGSIFYSPDRVPAIDSTVPLLGVSGLDNCHLPIAASAGLPPMTFPSAPNAGSAGSDNAGAGGAGGAAGSE